MTRTLKPMVVMMVALAGSSVAAADRPTKPRGEPTVAAIVSRAGVAYETAELRHLLDDTTALADDYAARRAAIRACHAERYAAARDNVLTGRAATLRSC